MEETIVIPSPNWFHVSILGASQDGWLVYGGPSKSLCFLEPLPLDSIGTIDSKQRFRAHVFHRAHKEKIVSVDISSEWPEKRNIITGGYDGVVKEWNIEPQGRSWTINYLHCHEEHSVQKEEVAGVCYGTQTFAVSVGTGGNVCRWDLNTNVVKRYSTHLRNFKPTCISCSPHKQLHVAIGTRQGVIFVIDISGVAGKLIYKVRGQDDEINGVSWCPQYSVTANKILGKQKQKRMESFSASSRMERIRNNLEPSEALEAAIADRKQTKDESLNKQEEEEEVIIPEDDMFDVYKDHEANEFGHKKFEPEDILVKVKDEPKDDFLTECQRLKEAILKNKNEPEESIESLVEAMDKAHVKEVPGDGDKQQDLTQETLETTTETHESTQETQESTQESQEPKQETHENNEYKHLLASVGKYGGVRIWTQTGKLLASCTVLFPLKKDQKDHKNKGPNWPTLHWFKPDSLLLADGKNQVLEANPLNIDAKNKLDWRVVHSLHRRGLYFLSSNAPRVQTPDILADPASHNWVVWTIGQDRNVISYNMKENKKIEVFASCGAFFYDIKPCAYDAGKVAITAGDGSIRVWETHTTNELEDQLASGVITSYWQNVQGKVLTLAWHPTKENLLVFATAESRVGILDASGSCEKPAKNFPTTFKQGVYSLSWGEGMTFYACGNGELAVFRANRLDEPGQEITVEIEGQKWDICSVLWSPHGVMVGAVNGGVALLEHKDHHVITATFVFLKMIYTIAWHPQQITSSQEESKYQNYIAVCSIDRVNTIALLEFEDKGDGAKQFKKILEPLSGHEGAILQVAWNPHRDAQLLSTSQDATVRIWNVVEGECIAIFGGHTISAQSAMWCPQPRLADRVLSCGGDSCLRLWDIRDYPVDSFEGVKKDAPKKKKHNRAREEKKKEKKRELKEKLEEADKKDSTTQNDITGNTDEIDERKEAQTGTTENVATTVELKLRGSKVFLLPITARQISKRAMTSVRTVLTNYIEENNGIDIQDLIKRFVPKEKGLGFLKIFGTMNEMNELLDHEAEHHLEAQDWEAYLMLLFYRGRVDDMIQFASEHDLLDPYLMSLSPSVSFKYWKDTTQLYLAQLDRMAAKGQEDKICVYRFYGGIIFRKATAWLSMHNLKSCIEVLMEAVMFKEAYVLCRLRHMDSIAEEVLLKWACTTSSSGSLMMSAILHLVRGDISEASITLGRSNQLNYLKLAAQLAKLAGHNTFAAHIETRVKSKESEIVPTAEDELVELPSRIEALLNKSDSENTDSDDESDRDIIKAKAVNGKGAGDIVFEITDSSAPLNGNAPATNRRSLVEDVAAVNSNGAGDILVEITDSSAALNGNAPVTNGRVFVKDVAAVNSNGAGDIHEVVIPAALRGNVPGNVKGLVKDDVTIKVEDAGAKLGEE